MEFLFERDSPEEVKFFSALFKQMISLLCKPFRTETFDFSNDEYFKEIFEFGEKISTMPEVRSSKEARGSRHSLYINRTYFGLYNILNDLKANIKTTRPDWLSKPLEQVV